MKNTVVYFNTYAEALKAASNAYKDGYNTIIHRIGGKDKVFTTGWVNEYFIREAERFHDN